MSAAFSSDPASSGILGLGMSLGNTVRPARQVTFMDNIKAGLAAPVFTANLRHGVPGNYNFGWINKAEYTGAIQYAPVDTASIYWKFALTGYAIGTDRSVTAPFAAIADTGTTLLLLPDSVVTAFYAKIKGAAYDNYWGGVLFPCKATVPDFTFIYGNYKGSAPPPPFPLSVQV